MIVDGIETQEAPSDDRIVEVLMSDTGKGYRVYKVARWTSAGWVNARTTRPLAQKVVGWRELEWCACQRA
ncbi:hypothetical protein ADL19_15035 [Streptomyces purpurogeneiscleroticus]|nr:hypothetical protein ADL19_15035 [Streptomyces purpurogeneiscleroticus]